jgi:hypothetical protein
MSGKYHQNLKQQKKLNVKHQQQSMVEYHVISPPGPTP